MKRANTIRSEADKKRVITLIKNLPVDGTKDILVTEHRPDRSLAQNSLTHLHYSQLADQLYETPLETKCRLKLDYGVPVLMASDSIPARAFAARWSRLSRGLTREDMLDAMSLVKLTSIMNLTEMSKYITDYMTAHEIEGYTLFHPEDLFSEAMGRHKNKETKK